MDGQTDGQTHLQRYVDASKNGKTQPFQEHVGKDLKRPAMMKRTKQVRRRGKEAPSEKEKKKNKSELDCFDNMERKEREREPARVNLT